MNTIEECFAEVGCLSHRVKLALAHVRLIHAKADYKAGRCCIEWLIVCTGEFNALSR